MTTFPPRNLARLSLRSFIMMLANYAIFVSLGAVARAHRIPRSRGATIETRHLGQPIYRKYGGQDKRDGAMRRPSPCLHILSDGAMPWRHGAIVAPIACAASILAAPNWRIRTKAPISLGQPLSQVESIDDGA